jgi:hypothetical protein
MAWLEQKPSGRYDVAFRFGGLKFKKSLRTSDSEKARARLHRLEESISLVESGRLELPEDADVATFLLSDGRLNGKVGLRSNLRTYGQFKKAFLESIPAGSLEDSTLTGMRIHFKHLARVLGNTFVLPSLSLEDCHRALQNQPLMGASKPASEQGFIP